MNISSENKKKRKNESWASRLCDTFVSAQLLPVGILLNFFVLAATFVDWENLFAKDSTVFIIYSFSGTIFISALLASAIWLVQAVRGKTRVEYFKRHRLFIIVEQLTFVAWLLSGIFFSALDITLSESTATLLFTATCGLGMLTYFLITMFAEKVCAKPEKEDNKKLDAAVTGLTLGAIIDEIV